MIVKHEAVSLLKKHDGEQNLASQHFAREQGQSALRGSARRTVKAAGNKRAKQHSDRGGLGLSFWTALTKGL